MFEGTNALNDLKVRHITSPSPQSREVEGDRLAASYAPALAHGGPLCAGFLSLLQRDHLGVEFALEAHSQLLRAKGAFIPALSLLGSAAPPLDLAALRP